MKSTFFRNLTKLGLAATTIIGSTFLAGFQVLALPTEEVVQKLDPIPVFSLTNDAGDPLLFQVSNNPKAARMTLFVSPQDAQNFMTTLKKENPEAATNYDNVTPFPLGRIYQIALENKDQENPIYFNFQPQQTEVTSAVDLIRKENQQINEWKGVPLFFAIVKKDGQEAYLPTEQGKIPLFFEKATLQKQLDQLKQSQPDIASSVDIKVIRLEDLIAAFTSKDDTSLSNMILVPTNESMQFIQSMPKNEAPN
jgi:nickel transport protein